MMNAKFPENIEEQNHKVPLWLKAVYAVVAAWCLWYLVSSLVRHGTVAFEPGGEQQTAEGGNQS